MCITIDTNHVSDYRYSILSHALVSHSLHDAVMYSMSFLFLLIFREVDLGETCQELPTQRVDWFEFLRCPFSSSSRMTIECKTLPLEAVIGFSGKRKRNILKRITERETDFDFFVSFVSLDLCQRQCSKRTSTHSLWKVHFVPFGFNSDHERY